MFLNLTCLIINRYPLEMHMVHVEDNFIGPKGLVNIADAAAAKHGLAVLGIFFFIDNSKPQVNHLFHRYSLVFLSFQKN